MGVETDRETLARVLMRDHGCILHNGPGSGACRACRRRADLILSSDALAARDAELIAATREQVVGEAVEAIRAERHVVAQVWGGPSPWLTTGAKVADVSSDYFAEAVANLLDGRQE